VPRLGIPCLGILARNLIREVVSRAVDSIGGTGRVFTITYREIPLFRDRQRDNKQRNMPLLTSNNKRIDQRNIFGEEMAGIGQVDLGEITIRYGEEEAARLMEEIIKTQKQLEGLLVEVEKKRQQEDREMEKRREREQEEMDRWMEECRKRNKKEREEKEKKRRIDEEWKRIENMRRREEKRAEKEWRCQEIKEARREENRRIAMEERKCFECGGFGHMASHCRNRRGEEPVQVSSNRFEVLKVRVMQRGKEVVKKP